MYIKRLYKTLTEEVYLADGGLRISLNVARQALTRVVSQGERRAFGSRWLKFLRFMRDARGKYDEEITRARDADLLILTRQASSFSSSRRVVLYEARSWLAHPTDNPQLSLLN